MIRISSGLKFQGDSESAVRILRFLPVWPAKAIFLKNNVGQKWFYIPNETFDIFWSGCCDITKLTSVHHFLCHKCITLAILWHKHETHSIVCTKCGSKGITQKFTVSHSITLLSTILYIPFILLSFGILKATTPQGQDGQCPTCQVKVPPGFQYWCNYTLGNIIEMHIGLQEHHGHPNWWNGTSLTNERLRK